MKNYELIAMLMELPAGYDVNVGRTVTREEDSVFYSGSIEDVDISENSKTIDLLIEVD